MKRSVAIIVLAVAALVAMQGRTVRDFFAAEPDDIFLLVPRTVRLDMLDYHDSGQQPMMTNRLGAGTQLLELDSAYLKMRTSDARTVELLVMPYSQRDTILAVVETVLAPAPDSRLRFFNSNWVELSSIRPLKTMPALDDFVLPSATREQRRALAERMPLAMLEMTITGAAHDTLVVRHNADRQLSREEYRQYAAPLLRPELRYTIAGGKVKRIRN